MASLIQRDSAPSQPLVLIAKAASVGHARQDVFFVVSAHFMHHAHIIYPNRCVGYVTADFSF
jgi:hypothetical protein